MYIVMSTDAQSLEQVLLKKDLKLIKHFHPSVYVELKLDEIQGKYSALASK